jgi:glycolate oxidase iron-sulfur subunit
MNVPTSPAGGFKRPDKPVWEDFARCVHCGLCLNHCPTYRLWGLEADSPRGRIRQMLLVELGHLELGADFVQHIDQCLDCRACETACPSGVDYGKLVEAARAEIEDQFPRPAKEKFLRNLVYRHLLPYPRRISLLARLLRVYQRTPLRNWARALGVLRAAGLEEREALMPPVDDEFFFKQMGRTFPARGPRRARVAFFAGCVAQVTFARLNEATIRVLTANGCEVVVPDGQRCCGALAAHAGVRDVARQLAGRNVDVFLRESFDAVITNAAGCGSTLKEYAHLFPAKPDGERQPHGGEGSTENREKAQEFSGKVRDVTEFLDGLGLSARLREVKLRVTYQDSCHLAHGQRVREAPRHLIRAVPGVELVEMMRADDCCGSAGVYNVTQTEAAMGILDEKMRHVCRTGVQAIVTANPGCMLQLRAGLARGQAAGTAEQANGGTDPEAYPREVLHVVELLDRALV